MNNCTPKGMKLWQVTRIVYGKEGTNKKRLAVDTFNVSAHDEAKAKTKGSIVGQAEWILYIRVVEATIEARLTYLEGLHTGEILKYIHREFGNL